MNKKLLAIVKLNILNNGRAYIITGIFLLLFLVQESSYIIDIVTGNDDGADYRASIGFALYLLILFSAIGIPIDNFHKLINLGGKRSDFFKSALLTYIVLACFVALANLAICYTYDRVWDDTNTKIFNVIEAAGWNTHGPFATILQQFAFLLLVSVVIHTLSLIHVLLRGSWRGWFFDGMLLAFIIACLSFEPLGSALKWFFQRFVFQPNLFLQIPICLGLTGIVYGLSFFLVYQKEI
ncbi:MAG: hypothetical protein LBJ41_01340 [Treponema sp.]|jgi:hypothetical protein|nr:hypothetical protein [Treponema sp.]